MRAILFPLVIFYILSFEFVSPHFYDNAQAEFDDELLGGSHSLHHFLKGELNGNFERYIHTHKNKQTNTSHMLHFAYPFTFTCTEEDGGKIHRRRFNGLFAQNTLYACILNAYSLNFKFNENSMIRFRESEFSDSIYHIHALSMAKEEEGKKKNAKRNHCALDSEDSNNH